MEINFEGGSRFVIRGTKTVVINPVEKQPKDVLSLFTTRLPKSKGLVNGPGEYEIGGVLVGTVVVGEPRSKDLAHAATVDDITVCAFSGNPEALDPRALDALGRIDVLLIGDTPPEVAQKAVSLLEPRVTVAGGDKAQEVALALGVKDAEPRPRFTWNGVSTAPRAVVLKAPARSRRAA